ncbi:MAG TPA: bifunctional YncE family protein/alkaline phosphatase family protein [Gemmatimonadaceae bacterium]|nr:bifunctional YncE family protein/alkaline phosphatase family protein [Gemmatimonadaceae bacterium]
MHRPIRLIALLLVAACGTSSSSTSGTFEADLGRLPTGARLDPAGRTVDIGDFPMTELLSPDSSRVVLLLGAYRQQGLQVIDRRSGDVVQTLLQPAAFVGLAFSPDGTKLYASGGFGDNVYVYAWRHDSAALVDSIGLSKKKGQRYPAGLGVSPDGKTLYVAENLDDSLAIIDLASRRVRRRIPTGRYPYAVVVDKDGTIFVSAWGSHTVSVFPQNKRIDVARHPSSMLLDGTNLYVVSASTDRIDVIDTKTQTVVKRIADSVPGASEGSTPEGIAISGGRLYVAEADNNAVAQIDLGTNSIVGRIPVGWYPTAVVAGPGDTLYVANAKGHGSRPNEATGYRIGAKSSDPFGYTLGQLAGTLTIVPGRDNYGSRVAQANGWTQDTGARAYPPIEHVVYIIKENRTYDQVLGDEAQGDGDTSLVFFGRFVSPNHHALADRFGLYDRFFVNAEVSADGHQWSTAAYATDYTEKTTPDNYSDRGRDYDYDGTNRKNVPADGDDVAAPAAGYLWDLAVAKGLSLRNYGEFAVEHGRSAEDATSHGVVTASKPALAARTCPTYAGFDVKITDQARADVWIGELHAFERDGSMPALEILTLPNDHTAGATPRAPTPRAYMADNDWALGRMIDALSHSRFWRSTAVFVAEDDAQDGADHVDSHRAPFLVISPWTRGGVVHRFTNTTDVIRTIEEILKLPSMSQFDAYGRPLRGIWRTVPDTTPYTAHASNIDLAEHNPDTGKVARVSSTLDFRVADAADSRVLNRVLWETIKGPDVPYPVFRRRPPAGL